MNQSNVGAEIKQAADGLVSWLSYPEKPFNDLLDLIGNNTESLVMYLGEKGNVDELQSVLNELLQRINVAGIEKRLKCNDYSGAFPAPLMMRARDSHPLNVVKTFKRATERYGVVSSIQFQTPTRSTQSRKVSQTLPATKPEKQRKSKRVVISVDDVFDGGQVRRGYWEQVKTYACKHATQVKQQFSGNMVASTQTTVWELKEGAVTWTPGAFGRRARLFVHPIDLRRAILLYLGAD